MKNAAAALTFASIASGCVFAPLPDGSYIERATTEQMAQAAPKLSADERERQRRVDAEVQDEQRRAIAQEERLRQLDAARQLWDFYGSYGWGPGPWPWYRDRWGTRLWWGRPY